MSSPDFIYNVLAIESAHDLAGIGLSRFSLSSPVEECRRAYLHRPDEQAPERVPYTLMSAITQTFPARQSTEYMLPTLNTILKNSGLRLQDLHLIVWNHGPGSFTGIRLAAGFIQGLLLPYQMRLEMHLKTRLIKPSTHFAEITEVLPLSTFDIYAQQLADAFFHALSSVDKLEDLSDSAIAISQTSALMPDVSFRFLCAHDARAGELYWQMMTFTRRAGEGVVGWQSHHPVRLNTPADIAQAIAKDKGDEEPYCHGFLGNGLKTYPQLKELILPIAQRMARAEYQTDSKKNPAHRVESFSAFAELLEKIQPALTAINQPSTLEGHLNTMCQLGFLRYCHTKPATNPILPLYVRDKVAFTLQEQQERKAQKNV